MKEDFENISNTLQSYINLIIKEYGKYMDEDIIYDLKNNNDLITWDDNTISFFVRRGKLYLPKKAYIIFPILQEDKNYKMNLDNYVKEEDYLNTTTTYMDYIHHVIECGLSVYDYFIESLLHEAMHLCGSDGGNSFLEGINELETRKLAQKYHVKIAAMGYPKEVELAKKFQSIIGEDVMDELAFCDCNKDKAKKLLSSKCGDDVALLYEKVIDASYQNKELLTEALNTSNPFKKAEIYDKIQYEKANKILDDFISNKDIKKM